MVRSVIAVALFAVAGTALAAPNAIRHIGLDEIHNHRVPTIAAPEISPAGAISALTLVLGGLAMVRGRRKS